MMWKGAAVFGCCFCYVTVMVVMKKATEKHLPASADHSLYLSDTDIAARPSTLETSGTRRSQEPRSGCVVRSSRKGEIILCEDIKGSLSVETFPGKPHINESETNSRTNVLRARETLDSADNVGTADDLPPLSGDVFNMIDSAKDLNTGAGGDNDVSHRNQDHPLAGKRVKSSVRGKPYDYSIPLVVDQAHLCQTTEDDKPVSGPFLFLLIHSHPSHRYRRNAIRDTWGSIVKNYTHVPRIVIGFFLGTPDANADGLRLDKEISIYRDMIQYDFRDDYGNLTLKSILALSWIHNFCSNATFILKTDDDVYFNVSNLLGVLKAQPVSELLVGSMNPSSQVQRFGQWKVRESIYPGPTYPPYCSGAAYVMSADVADALYREHGKTTTSFELLVPMEDVYVTGVLAMKAGLACKDNRAFPSWTTVPSPKSVFRFLRGEILGVHGLSHSGIYGLSKIVKQCRGCQSNVKVLRKWFSLLAGS